MQIRIFSVSTILVVGFFLISCSDENKVAQSFSEVKNPFLQQTDNFTFSAVLATTTWSPDPFDNTPPQLSKQYVTVTSGVLSRTPAVLLSAYDVENDRLSVINFTQPTHGKVTLNKDSTFNYTSHAGYIGEDPFSFTVTDNKSGGISVGTMFVNVVSSNSGKSGSINFLNLSQVKAAGEVIDLGQVSTVPLLVNWFSKAKKDLLVGANGKIWIYPNVGTSKAHNFKEGTQLQAHGQNIDFGSGRVGIAFVDMDQDGLKDLVATSALDKKVRYYRNTAISEKSQPVLDREIILQNSQNQDFLVEDIRVDVADWNGDGLPDIITGSWAGAVKIAYNIGSRQAPTYFADPVTKIDSQNFKLSGAYNLNVRLIDMNQDGTLDLVDSYNWGDIYARMNQGSSASPFIPENSKLKITNADGSDVNFHQLCDGPIVDFSDLNGDKVLDMVIGGERNGKIWIAYGKSWKTILGDIRELIAAHPNDLGLYLENAANKADKTKMQVLQADLYEYVVSYANLNQRQAIRNKLIAMIEEFPQYFKLQTFDLSSQPGMASLAAQTWLTTLLTGYFNPVVRAQLIKSAQMTGGYAKLVGEIGLIYVDNNLSPDAADAIYQWVRTVPRNVYPGTMITTNDWIGGRTYLVRGHMKNIFSVPLNSGGEFAFGSDAYAIIGDRGSENWFMTVVHHEASHDVDAYVRKNEALTKRWGEVLVAAGGPKMRADLLTGWLNWDLTKQSFLDAGLWDGNNDVWQSAWSNYWTSPEGADWNKYGFMRGNISWFYEAPQESLATQGNQYWNTTEGRLQVAINRWKNGYKSNLTEVILFMDIWSLGLNKMKFYETDDLSNQIISFARLRRNEYGYIDRIDLAENRYYEFVVNEKGVVTEIVHHPV
jgi:Bacterial Ig domain/FG-GAP-like repeat